MPQGLNQSNKSRDRLIIFIVTCLIFITAFIMNILMNNSLYNFNLNQVPVWQADQFLGSQTFLNFMNIVSNIFNPVICAGYILLFFLISYRKLQILVFLIWFIFLSWILSILKMTFHQARPYWILKSNPVKMLEWTCYTQFGMPSGHAMMAVVLMEFIVRFFARVSKFVQKYIILFYLLVVFFQICVIFSRVILGMHSLNQVLFGCLIGCFSLIPYYLYIQHLILKCVLKIFKKQKSSLTNIILLCSGIISLCISILIVTLINYQNNPYKLVIDSIEKCNGYKQYKSFQYRCLQDSTLLLAAIGILFAFNMIKNPSNLNLQLKYTRKSLRFIGKTIITLVIPLIVLLIFVNPIWQSIQTKNVQNKALIIWTCQSLGFFFSTVTLIYTIPLINTKFGFQVYKYPNNYTQFKKYEIFLQSKNQIISSLSQQNIQHEIVNKNKEQKQLSLIIDV